MCVCAVCAYRVVGEQCVIASVSVLLLLFVLSPVAVQRLMVAIYASSLWMCTGGAALGCAVGLSCGGV